MSAQGNHVQRAPREQRVMRLLACGQNAIVVSTVKAAGRPGQVTRIGQVTRMRQQVVTGEVAGPGAADGPGELGAWASGWVWQIPLPAAGHAPGFARQATGEVLASRHVAHVEETAVLFVSELVTNAVRHASTGGSMLVLRLEAAGTSLRIEVHDPDPQWPRPCIPAGLDESGFGFVIVDALATKWGVSNTATGKAVWAELAV